MNDRAGGPPESSVVVVTGGIGCGKSAVSAAFGRCGATVISADQVAREIVEPGLPAYREIVDYFGDAILAPSGEIDRKKLGEVIFNDDGERRRLEAMTHPRIRTRTRELFQEALTANAPLVVYECPLFFETDLHHMTWKHVVVVDTPELQVRERLLARDRLTPQEIDARLRAQIGRDIRLAGADTVLLNDGDLTQLELSVRKLYDMLTNSRSSPGTPPLR